MKARIPDNEVQRLEALLGYAILDTPPEPEFDELTELAALVCEAPTALVTLIDRERQWFKSCRGLAAHETHRDLSFCAHTILGTETLVVSDARHDPRFADNEFVTGEPHIRFYAGVPLIVSGGFAVGTLAVVDYRPRALSPEQRSALEALARQVVAQLELRRLLAEQRTALTRRAVEVIDSIDQRLRTAIRAANVGLWDWDLRTNRVFYSAEWKRQIGYEEDEIGDSFDEWRGRIHPHDLARLERAVAAFVRRPTGDYRQEFRFRHKDGSYRWILAQGSMQLDGNGRPARLLGTHVDITERRQQEIELQRSRDRLVQAERLAQTGYWHWEVPSRRVTWSQGICRILGVQPADFAGTHEAFLRLIVPDDVELVRATIRRILETRQPEHWEFRAIRPDGSTRYLRAAGEVAVDDEGNVTAVFGTGHDITAQRLAEDALRDAAEFNRQIVAGAREGIAVLDRELRYQVFNPFLEEISGWRAADVLGRPIASLLPPENREAILDQLRRSLAGEQADAIDLFFPARGDLAPRWISAHASPLRDAAGNITGVIALLADITARKAAETEVRHLNRVYAVLSTINQAIVRLREPSAILQAACRIAAESGGFELAWIGLADQTAGVIRPAAKAGPAADCVSEADIALASPGAHRLAAAAVRTGTRQVANALRPEDIPFECRSVPPLRLHASAAFPLQHGGRTVGVYQLYSAEPGFFDSAELLLLDELAIDIAFGLEVCERDTEWRRAEAGLRRSEERFRQLAESVQEVFWLADPGGGEVHYVSPAYERIWGEPCARLYADPTGWRASIHPDDRARVEASLAQHLKGEYDEEFRIVRPDRTVRWIRARTFPVHDAKGVVYRVAGVAEDVTERKSLESQLLRAQRMESVGRLATGVAHDMNNVLAPIMMAVALLRGGLSPAEMDKTLDSIETSARRGAGLAKQLLLFGRGVEAGRVAVKTSPWIGEVVSMLRETLPKTFAIDCRIAPDARPVRGDPTQLHQVLLNLCVNARDAMPEGGTLTLEAENVTLDESAKARQPEAQPGDYVRVRVTDTGTGIAPETIDRIFDPFFTTKQLGQGSGLGLSIALGIVKSHGGFLTVQSELGKGTTFEVFLPALQHGLEPEDQPPAPARRSGDGETILVVDDEPDVREVLSRTLEHAGYRVLQAADGAEALRLFALHGGDVALVLTDLDMPGMDGTVLLHQLRRLRPELPAVISSGVLGGRMAERRIKELHKLGVAALLNKPYSGDTVLAAVRDALR